MEKMLFFIILVSAVTIAPVAYFALSKKSNPLVRRAAIFALILILAAAIVCGILIFGGPRLPASSGGLSQQYSPETPRTSLKALLILMAILFLVIAVIIFFALRESIGKKKKGR
jgi:preprotein translocase subunit SecG